MGYRSSMRTTLYWLKRILAGAGILIVAVLIAGGLYQYGAQARDAAAFPMPGQTYPVATDERSLHLYCSGTNSPDSPTVILESGLTAPFAAWRLVQREVEVFARVCSYDRAGLGWSDDNVHPTRIDAVVSDLAALLRAADVDGPLILAGWSAGGVMVRAFTQRYPDRVAGLVLVDSAHESQQLRLPLDPSYEDAINTLSLCSRIAWSGLVRASGAMNQILEGVPLARNLRDEQLALFNRTGYCAGVLQEMQGFVLDVANPEGPPTLGELPLIVISRGLRMTPEASPAGADAAFAEQMNTAWSAMQAELATLSSRSEHWTAARSGHGIPYEQPQIIIAAIRRLVRTSDLVGHAAASRD